LDFPSLTKERWKFLKGLDNFNIMALEATHMRFALDLKDKYQVVDIEKYIVGSVYPDSRYVTGIDRTLTHGEWILADDFTVDDFHKGWQVHQLVDDIQAEIIKDYFPNLVPIFAKENKFTEREWPVFSAIKIIQDMDDLQKFDLRQSVKYLENYVFNPNGEDIKKVQRYNQIMINLYKGKKKTTVEDNYQMWLALGVDRKSALNIKEQTEGLLKDVKMIKRIETIYDEMLRRFFKNKVNN